MQIEWYEQWLKLQQENEFSLEKWKVSSLFQESVLMEIIFSYNQVRKMRLIANSNI